MTAKCITLAFGGRVYKVAPSLKLVCEIESEIGAVPELVEKFSTGRWDVRGLVTLIHILLHAAGRTADWAALGDAMIEEGLGPYVKTAVQFLQAVTE